MGKTAGTESADIPWLPRVLDAGLPPYLALLGQLELAIEAGTLRPGDRLPPHRALSVHLGVSIATVTKAYNEAQRRGMVVGERGRGMFVRAGATAEVAPAPVPAQVVNLGYSFAPQIGQGAVIAQVLRHVVADSFDVRLLSFQSHHGLPAHREAIAGWMAATSGLSPDPGNVVITNGGQHALSLAVAILRRSPDEPIMVEELSYAGFKALAATYKIPLVPLAMDEHGVIPEVVERVAAKTGARLLYATPTIQSPTARTIPLQRRKEIARVIERIGGWLIEDDVFSFMADTPLLPISSLIPDRSIYVISFSKVLELGLRLGAMVVPPGFADAAALAMRATSWTASPLMAEVVTQLINSGQLVDLVAAVREESRARRQVFRSVFGADVPPQEHAGYHMWLPLPLDRDPTDVFIAARAQGILVTPPGFAVGDVPEHGLRICLGGAADQDELRRALETVRRLIARSARQHILVT